jgi:hypothetical protein
LEKWAHEFIRIDDYMRRGEAARALRYFKSDDNIARVKSLLDDPKWVYARRAEENEGLEVRLYPVRQDAYVTLQYWGVAAEEPKIREETWKPDRVQSIGLSNQKVTAAELKSLARFENLQDLSLWNVELTHEALCDLAALKNLRALYLGGTNLTDGGLKHLAHLSRLRYLDLRGTKITDQGLKQLAEFKSLQKLDLKRAQVTDEGVAELRRLRPDLKIEQ